ncbi:MAG: hypothetical protein WAV16_01795 [Candidatus Moraniibacteriota bacterium]
MDSAFNQQSKDKRIEKSKSPQIDSLEILLYSKGKRRSNFFVGKSPLYFDCNDKEAILAADRSGADRFFDSLNYKIAKKYTQSGGNREDYLFIQYEKFIEKVLDYQDDLRDKKQLILDNLSIVRLWNTSILAAIIIGMISMSFIYRYLGTGATAEDFGDTAAVAGDYTEAVVAKEEWTEEREAEYLAEMAGYLQSEADRDFNIRAKELVAGYPIADMMPYIIEKDQRVAAFMIAIAKKESNWGKRVPVLDGEDCFNYWGYRGIREAMGTGGHTCFDGRKDAVDTVAKRIQELIEVYDRDTPEEMVVWKCGSNCAVTGGQVAANKWISDVDLILEKLVQED